MYVCIKGYLSRLFSLAANRHITRSRYFRLLITLGEKLKNSNLKYDLFIRLRWWKAPAKTRRTSMVVNQAMLQPN
jgi:hypothetical protein